MRSEREIRQHIADVELIMAQPCDCEARGRGEECRQTQRATKAVLNMLRWSLGDPAVEAIVADCHQRATAIRASSN